MKKQTLFSFLIIFIILSCKGPQGAIGPQGQKGDTGAVGATGATGKDGANGTSATARYYDYTLSFTGLESLSTTQYRIKNYDLTKEFPISYVFSNNGTFLKPIPSTVVAEDIITKTSKVVYLDVTYSTVGTSALIFIGDLYYKSNGAATYQFRTVLVPMLKGGRLNYNVNYSELEKKYNLVEAK